MNRDIFPKSVYKERQQRAFKAMKSDSIALLFAETTKNISADNDFAFVQSNNLSYLCGFPEQDCALALIKTKNRCFTKLYCRAKNPLKELWDGKIYGPDEAKKTFAIDEAASYHIMQQDIVQLYSDNNTTNLYYDFNDKNTARGLIPQLFDTIDRGLRRGLNSPQYSGNIGLIVAQLRVVKDSAEIELMRLAGTLSAEGHIKAMQGVGRCSHEYQLQALLEGYFIHSGGSKAYNSIVGAGNNACVLHYNNNASPLRNGDLVLIDAGARYREYCGDITRTFPVNGQFSTEQKAIYTIVLDAQLAAIDQCRVGNDYYAPHRTATKVIAAGLKQLNLITEDSQVTDFFPHGTGHWIGMDVHDISPYSEQGEVVCFETGMCLTIEPGIYIPNSMQKVPANYCGIGVRIEDDILITSGDPENLSGKVPKTIVEIEQIIAQA